MILNDEHVQFRFNNSLNTTSIQNFHGSNCRSSFYQHGTDILEYVVDNQDVRLTPQLRLPFAVIICIVILWSLSYFSSGCGITIVLVIILATYVNAWNTVVRETLLVKRTVGIQFTQTNILGRMCYAKYVPVENVKAVVVNEIIIKQRVVSYLLVILVSKESTGKILVPLLTGTLPRLRTIERIYEQIQNVLF